MSMYSGWWTSTFLRVLKFLQVKEGYLIFVGTNFTESLNYVIPLLYLELKSVMDPNSLSFIRSQCILDDGGIPFSESWNFYKLKRGKPILQKVWINSSPFLYWNSKGFVDPKSLSFIRFQCILHDSGVLFSESRNCYKLRRGNLISRGNQFCRKSELFSALFCIWISRVL